MQGNMRVSAVALLGAFLAVGCGAQQQQQDDSTLNVTGTESQPLTIDLEDGGTALGCPTEKSLICHVPPGNPVNEHTICVGTPAVDAHLGHHPDYQGECSNDGGTVLHEGPGGRGDDHGGFGRDAGDEDGDDTGSGDDGSDDGSIDAGTNPGTGDAGVIN